MKKILTTTITIILFLVFTPSFVSAQSTISSESAIPQNSIRDQAKQRRENMQNDKIANLKQRANTEIDRRLTSLNKLIDRLNKVKKLSSDQKTSLINQIQIQINDLTILKTEISADTDMETLRADVKSIVNSYKIYALFIPKIHILATADVILETSDKTTELSNKLQQRIDQAKTEGKDISSVQTYLTDMQSEIEDAKKQAQNAIDTVTPLTPEGFPGNKTTLQSARKMLKTARQDLHTARLDAKKIINELKTRKSSLDTNSATSSSQ